MKKRQQKGKRECDFPWREIGESGNGMGRIWLP